MAPKWLLLALCLASACSIAYPSPRTEPSSSSSSSSPSSSQQSIAAASAPAVTEYEEPEFIESFSSSDAAAEFLEEDSSASSESSKSGKGGKGKSKKHSRGGSTSSEGSAESGEQSSFNALIRPKILHIPDAIGPPPPLRMPQPPARLFANWPITQIPFSHYDPTQLYYPGAPMRLTPSAAPFPFAFRPFEDSVDSNMGRPSPFSGVPANYVFSPSPWNHYGFHPSNSFLSFVYPYQWSPASAPPSSYPQYPARGFHAWTMNPYVYGSAGGAGAYAMTDPWGNPIKAGGGEGSEGAGEAAAASESSS